MRIASFLRFAAVVIAICMFIYGFSPSVQWQKYTDTGRSALLSGNYSEAERNFRAALDEAQHFSAGDPRVRESMDNLAAVYQSNESAGNSVRVRQTNPHGAGMVAHAKHALRHG